MHLISSSEGFALYQKCLEIERAAKSEAEEARRRKKEAIEHDREGRKEGREKKDKEKDRGSFEIETGEQAENANDLASLLFKEKLPEQSQPMMTLEDDALGSHTKKIMRYIRS